MVMQFLSGGYLARWNLLNQERFFSRIPSASDTTDNMESKQISQIHPLSSNVDCIFDRNTHIYISYPIFGDDDKLVLCHFSKCLYQHRSDEILFKKTQSFGPVRRYFCMTHVQFAYKRHAIVSFHLFKQFNSLSMELINLF